MPLEDIQRISNATTGCVQLCRIIKDPSGTPCAVARHFSLLVLLLTTGCNNDAVNIVPATCTDTASRCSGKLLCSDRQRMHVLHVPLYLTQRPYAGRILMSKEASLFRSFASEAHSGAATTQCNARWGCWYRWKICMDALMR
jgi:hypothetical protein